MDPCLQYYIRISNHEPSPLARAVFTQKNVNDLQSAIQKEVYEKTSGIRITKQTDEALLSVMYNTYLFLVHKSTGPNSQKQSINEMDVGALCFINQHIVDQSAGIVLHSLASKSKYLQEISKPRQINTLPVSDNIYGAEKEMRYKHGL
jgi:hypothetical protein